MGRIPGTLPITQQIASGQVPGVSYRTVFGRNSDIDTTGGEDIWNGGGIYTGFPVGTAETVTCVSDSTNDTVAGTGCRTLELHGLDANGITQAETITMSGTAPVESTKLWSRVSLCHGASGGSGQANAGSITVAHSSTTENVFSVMPIAYGSSQDCVFTVPSDMGGALVTAVDISVSNVAQGQDKEVEVAFAHRVAGSSFFRCEQPTDVSTGDRSVIMRHGGLLLGPGADVSLRVISSTGDDLVVTGMMEIVTFV